MTDQIVTPQPEPPQTGNQLNVTALISMISGILTYTWWIITNLLDVSGILALVLAPITAIVAIATGATAKRKIRQSNGLLGGKKMANAGLWLGWIYIILCVLVLVLVLILGATIISAIAGLLK
jgi:hypothetical protein